jgi:dCTP deaminase
MSVLTKSEILSRIKEANIRFNPPLDTFQIQAHAIDMRLGFTFLVPKAWHLTKKGRVALNIDYFDKSHPAYFDTVELEQGQYFELLPGEYVLVSTLESVSVPDDLMAILYPRSSTNRKGLSVDLTGIVDSGYSGQLVVPIRNNTVSQIVKLYPGERFCQIVFEQLDTKVHAEKSRYHNKDIIEGFIRNKNKKDSTEIAYIAKGKIRELKAKHGVKEKA